ncbi:MAG: OsmC family protein [bacterium]|nr:OsmC family protein [bacterium]
MKTKTKWIDGLLMLSEAETGHGLPLASRLNESEKLNGIRPVELLLHALAGCSGMDVISILKKMKQPVEKFWIEVEGERASEHPKVFTKIHVTYFFQGQGLEPEKVERAIHLSHEKYCSVSAMLSKSCEITTSYVINPSD